MVQEIHDKELQHEESKDEELQLDDHKLQGDAPWTVLLDSRMGGLPRAKHGMSVISMLCYKFCECVFPR